jgi:arylsulfatase A-like enzyme
MAMTSKPNILFIAIDDINQWIGCLGKNHDVKTPNLDRLAEQGVLFTNACCPAPVCNPSRTSILTGLLPSTTGCYLLPDNLEGSPRRDVTLPLPLLFRRNGYHTMSIGKIDHGASVERSTQATVGESMWDDNQGFLNSQQFDLLSRNGGSMRHVNGWPAFANHWGPMDDEQTETLSDVLTTRWVSDKLRQDSDKPFFLAAGFYRPHMPLIAPQRFFDMYDKNQLTLPDTGPEDFGDMPPMARQVALAGYQDFERGTHWQIQQHGVERDWVQAYLACISFTDDCIGQVLKALEDGPHAENTIVVVWGDNGFSFGDHFHWKKWSLWDSGAAVPLIIKAPGVSQRGSRCDQGVSLVDLYPTLVDLCGLPLVPELEGESLRGLLSGEQPVRDRPALTSFGPNNHSLRTQRYRYTRYCDRSEELYDYEQDQLEHRNLAADPAYAEVKANLARRLPTDCAPAVASLPRPGAALELEPGQGVWFRGLEHGFAGERIRISATVKAEGDDGGIVHHAGYFANYALYVKERRLCMAVGDVETPLRWDRLELRETIVRSETPLPREQVEVEGVLEKDGSIVILVDGAIVGRGKREHALSVYPAGLLNVGKVGGNGFVPVGDVQRSESFPGVLSNVRVAFGDCASAEPHD